MVALALVATILPFVMSEVALAAGTPNIAMTASAPARVLVGNNNSTISYAANVTNPTGTNGYNLSFRVVLPAGVSYVAGTAGSAGDPTIIANQPAANQTTLLFVNVADVLANSSGALAFDAVTNGTTNPVNTDVITTFNAYVNSDPRTVPTFNATTGALTGGQTGSATGVTATTRIVALDIEKSEPSPEGEILRGVHAHTTTYSLDVTNNAKAATNGVTVIDYLPAVLEFLGCGTSDNTTDAPTNPSNTVEYPSAASLTSTPDVPSCIAPTSVDTVNTDPDGAGPLTTGVYTKVTWTLGNLAADSSPSTPTVQIIYRAGIALRENTMAWTTVGGTPATTGAQTANLDNNSGPETTDEQLIRNWASAAGTYTGTVKAATSTATSDDDVLDRTAEDVRQLKTASTSTITQGGTTTWTITVQTGEYRSGQNIIVTDPVPDGLDVTSTSGPTGSATHPAPVTTTDLTWPAFDLGVSSIAVLTVDTTTRDTYRGSGLPVLGRDEWENTTALTGTAPRVIDDVANSLPANPAIVDASAAGQSADPISITKEVSVPGAAGTILLDCASGSLTWASADDAATAPSSYRPGDRVCYRLTVDYPSNLDFRDSTVLDFIPPGSTYEAVWGGANGETAAHTAGSVTLTDGGGGSLTSADNALLWTLPPYVDATPGAKRFQVVFSVLTVTAPSQSAAAVAVNNLMKVSTKNTAGSAVSLRDSAIHKQVEPRLTLSKSATPTSGVVANSTVNYTVGVTNTAATPDAGGYATALDATVWDVLPTQIDCSMVTAISGSGSCNTTPNPDRLEWSIGSIAAGATTNLTYTVTVPVGIGASETLTNTAGVRDYFGGTNVDSNTDTIPDRVRYIPVSNIDSTLTGNTVLAKASANVTTAGVTLTKTAVTSVNATGNNTASQATIGEYVDYTVTATIPAGTELYNSPTLTDTFPTGFSYQSSPAPVATLVNSANPGGTPLSVTIAGDSRSWTVALPDTDVLSGTQYDNAPSSGADTVTVTFRLLVDDLTGAGGNNRSTVRTNNVSLPWNDSVGTTHTANASHVTTIVEPNITLTKVADKATANPGDTVTYTINATNPTAPGNVSTAHDTVIVDLLPLGITPALPIANSGVWNSGARTITWPAIDIAPGAAAVVRTYDVTIDNPATGGGTFINAVIADATSLSGTVTGERTTYHASASASVNAPAVLVSKSASPTALTIGEDITWTVSVVIPANVQVFDALVDDALPAGLTFQSYGTPVCVGGCGLTATGLTASGQNIGWHLGDISATGTARTLDLPVVTRVADVVGNTGSTVVTNNVLVHWNLTNVQSSAPTLGSLPTYTNATPIASATVNLDEPTLRIDKDVTNVAGCDTTAGNTADADACSTTASGTKSFRLVVSNVGDATAYGAVVNDLPPAGFSNVVVTTPLPGGVTEADGWTVGDPDLSFTIASIAPSATVTITYTATIATSPVLANASTLVNTASIPSYTGVSGGTAPRYRVYNNVTPDTVTLTMATPSLGDRVWFDIDADGIDDSGEPGVAGMTVTLLWGGIDGNLSTTVDNVTYTTTTDATGAYSFALPGFGAGQNYQVSITPPSGMTTTFDRNGATNGLGTATLAVTTNTNVTDADFGLTGTGSIGDRVWLDGDSDTVQDSGEVGIPGIAVSLVWGGVDADLATAGDNVTFATTTGADGVWGVSHLPAGPYRASVTVTGMTQTFDLDGLGTADQATTSLTAGQNRVDVDFGYNAAASMGDLVWLDRDGDGVADPDEPGIVAVPVSALWAGPDGNLATTADNLTFTTTTDGNGQWSLTGLPPGTYRVTTTPGALTPTFDLDGTGTANQAAATLTSGQHRTDVDFGYRGTATLGDLVWQDSNRDGAFNGGEHGIEAVSVRATWAGLDNVLGNADDVVIGTIDTSAIGAYQFTNLPSGSYRVDLISGTYPASAQQTYDLDGISSAATAVVVVPDATVVSTADFGMFLAGSIGDLVWVDLDHDGVADSGEPPIPNVTVTLRHAGNDGVLNTGDDSVASTTTSAAGIYVFDDVAIGNFVVTVDATTIPAGLSPVSDLDGTATGHTASGPLATGETKRDVDFGYGGTACVSRTIFEDRNGNGVRDSGEPGINGVTVRATWAGLDGVLGNSDDLTLSDVTDADGTYQICGLPAGVIMLSVDVSTVPGLVNTSDPDRVNNATTQLTVVMGDNVTNIDFGFQAQADLAIAKTAVGAFTSGGQAQYSLRVTNAGPSTPNVLTVTDDLPAGLTFISGTGDGFTCTAAAQLVSCVRSTSLAVRSTATITLTVAVATTGEISNTARVSSPMLDPRVGDNTSTANVSAVSAAGTGRLPLTGTEISDLLVLAGALLCTGGLLIAARRRR